MRSRQNPAPRPAVLRAHPAFRKKESLRRSVFRLYQGIQPTFFGTKTSICPQGTPICPHSRSPSVSCCPPSVPLSSPASPLQQPAPMASAFPHRACPSCVPALYPHPYVAADPASDPPERPFARYPWSRSRRRVRFRAGFLSYPYCFPSGLPPKRRGTVSLSIYATSRFITRIANDTPSGYEPKYRISTVMSPQPTP